MRAAQSATFTRTPQHRYDIQALRILAVGAVIAFHLFPSALPGGFVGVDVFFVISGYLITGLLIRDGELHGHPRIGLFYTRRVRRLLPQSFLVLVSTTLASWWWAPATVWEQWRGELAASALQLENWHLIRMAADYNAADDGASPVQHYWSLGVEEQYYLVWPLLLLVVWVTAKQRGAALKVLAASSAFSLGLCLAWHPENHAAEYFNTFARLWEFGAGGLVLLISTRLRRGSTIVWLIGLCAVLISCAVLHESSYPGPGALLPTLGTMMMLSTGANLATPLFRVLRPRPVQYLGDLTYGIYLWHWPLLVILPYITRPDAPLKVLVVLGGSILLSALVLPVENRIRAGARTPSGGSSARRSFLISFTALVCATAFGVSFPAVVLRHTSMSRNASAPAITSVDQLKGKPCFGAAALLPNAHCQAVTTVTPDPVEAAKNMPEERCKAPLGSARVITCSFGKGRKRVVLVGDSHAQRWLPALKLIAQKNDWTLTTFLKGSCPFSTVPLRKYASSCEQWNTSAANQIKDLKPQLLITAAASGADYAAHGGESSQSAGMRGTLDQWKTLQQENPRIVVIRDNPIPGYARMDPPSCVSTKGPSECSFDEAKALKPDAQVDAAKQWKEALVIDLTPYFCLKGKCPSVIGGVMVYRDGQHIIDTFAETLAPMIETELSHAHD